MPRKKVGKRPELAEVEFAQAEVWGRLKEAPLLNFDRHRQKDIIRGVMLVGKKDMEVPVLARGKTAKVFATRKLGDIFGVKGKLVIHKWKTGEGHPREQMEVEAESVLQDAPF